MNYLRLEPRRARGLVGGIACARFLYADIMTHLRLIFSWRLAYQTGLSYGC